MHDSFRKAQIMSETAAVTAALDGKTEPPATAAELAELGKRREEARHSLDHWAAGATLRQDSSTFGPIGALDRMVLENPKAVLEFQRAFAKTSGQTA